MSDAEGPRVPGLEPDALLARLDTAWVARAYRWLERTDSTNRVAAEWADEGAPHGAAVVAETQDAGRGRLGRSFFSPAYRNLYTSIVLRRGLEPTLAFAAGVAVARAAAETLGDRAAIELKWPNDLLVGGRKAAGILVESSGSRGSRVAVLGIGVNLNVDPEEFPQEFRDRATSLAACAGHPIDRTGFAVALYGTLENALERHERGGFEAIRDEFEAFFRMRGRRVGVHEVTSGAGAQGVEGRVLGVASDGALRIERDDGAEERVLAGDVTIAKETPA